LQHIIENAKGPGTRISATITVRKATTKKERKVEGLRLRV